jgi:hypothetical protein
MPVKKLQEGNSYLGLPCLHLPGTQKYLDIPSWFTYGSYEGKFSRQEKTSIRHNEMDRRNSNHVKGPGFMAILEHLRLSFLIMYTWRF